MLYQEHRPPTPTNKKLVKIEVGVLLRLVANPYIIAISKAYLSGMKWMLAPLDWERSLRHIIESPNLFG